MARWPRLAMMLSISTHSPNTAEPAGSCVAGSSSHWE
uniref:Uncharacterized protein n=1 Tax=Rhizophora mucronata TaxID=61149 RepID=A0A2P2R4F5_RHIMU